MPSISYATRDSWKNWIKKDQDLHTQARRSPLHVCDVTSDYIEVLPKDQHKVRLDYDHLDALWQHRDIVNDEISKPRGKGKVSLNTMANRIWKENRLKPDNTNESYYWAVVCTRMQGEEGLLGLDSDYEAAEGNPRLVQHLLRERNRTLVVKKKQAVLDALGNLACEACGFDFAERYQDLGKDFCEVHHRILLAKGRTNLRQLAILCSNCHRMIHRTDPMEPIETFQKRLLNQ
jgi:predicted HNH restriction endonuclease